MAPAGFLAAADVADGAAEVGAGATPGMTGTLTLHYRRATPLGELRAESWIDRSDGAKTWAKGHILDAEGVTVEAEGLFILPRWAREAIAAHRAERDAPPTPSYFE